MRYWITALINLLFLTVQAQTPPLRADSLPAAPIAKSAPKPRKLYTVPDPTPFAQAISPTRLRELVEALAGPEFEGRETGQPGQYKAGEYIAEQFKNMDLPPVADRRTFFQNIKLQNVSWDNLSFKLNETEFKNRKDYFVMHAYMANTPPIRAKELVFVGYGIEEGAYSDYGSADVRDKVVIFYDGEPLDAEGRSLVAKTGFRSAWFMDWRKKVQLAKSKGAKACIVVEPNFEEKLKIHRKDIAINGWQPATSDYPTRPQGFVPTFFVSPECANLILGKKSDKALEAIQNSASGKRAKPFKFSANIEMAAEKSIKYLEGTNVLGFIEGVDPDLKKEIVVITAHYDHLGKSDETIYYGADDNASGTAGVIEIARAFAEARKKGVGPKRSVLCMLVSGEEKGLLGSKFYAEFPIFPLDKTVANINIDMIGRVDKRHENNPNYIYVIGSDRMSQDLHDINEEMNDSYTKLELDYKYNNPNDPNRFYERSDHYNFVQKGIPAVFFFSGTHSDYHRPTDTPDKLNYELIAKRAQLAFYTAWEIANRPYRITISKREEGGKE